MLGTLACIVRFGVNFPLGPDESYLVINLARRGWADLLAPLDYHQVAPPLFLVVEHLLTVVGGFNEWTLRALPCLLAVLSLFLFRALARRVLADWPYVMAVAIFCCSYWIVRYSSEAKPYSFDLLVSLAFTLLAVKWYGARFAWKHTAALAGLALVAFGFSFPAVFVGGGVVLFMGVTGLRRDHRHRLVHAAVVGAALVTGFAVGYALHATHQMDSELTWMQGYWERAFPPFSSAADFLVWLGRRASGEMMPYPVGGKNFGSIVTLLCFLLGVAAFLRRRRFGLLWLLTAPIGLTFVAACLERYPFGAPTRCQLHLAPVFTLLAGAGLAALLRPRGSSRLGDVRLLVACGGLSLVSVFTMARDVVKPEKTSTDRAHRDLARVVWRGGDADDRPVLSLREDLGVSFTPELDTYQTQLVGFLCNYYIYRRPDRLPGDGGTWSKGVRVITHRVFGQYDAGLRQAWIESFEAEHGLAFTGSALIPIPEVDNRERVMRVDVVEIMSFDPTAG